MFFERFSLFFVGVSQLSLRLFFVRSRCNDIYGLASNTLLIPNFRLSLVSLIIQNAPLDETTLFKFLFLCDLNYFR